MAEPDKLGADAAEAPAPAPPAGLFLACSQKLTSLKHAGNLLKGTKVLMGACSLNWLRKRLSLLKLCTPDTSKPPQYEIEYQVRVLEILGESYITCTMSGMIKG